MQLQYAKIKVLKNVIVAPKYSTMTTQSLLRKKIVPIWGTKITENKAKESLVHMHFRKECLKKAKFNFSLLKICSSSSYVFSENEIFTLEIGSEMKFQKHIKVKLTKKIT